MKAFFQNTILTLVSVLVGLAVMEAAMRIAGMRPASAATGVGEAALQKVIVFDPALESRYQPGAQTTIRSQYDEFEVRYRFNELGLRDRPLPAAGPQAPFKILALGNSLVEGWGVPEDRIFVRVAEARLGALPPSADSVGVRIVNGGISGYGAAQSYLFAKELTAKVKPQAVVFFYVSTMVHFDKRFLMRSDTGADGIAVGLSADALLQPTSANRTAPATDILDSSFVRSATQHSAIVNIIVSRLAIRREQQKIVAGDPQVDLLAGVRADPARLAGLHEPSLRHVAAVARLAKALRVPFLLVHLPLPHQLSAVEWSKGRLAYGLDAQIYPAPDRAIVDEFCRKENLQCISAFDVLQHSAAQSAEQRKLFYDYDFHPNPYGSEILGQWLGDELARRLRRR